MKFAYINGKILNGDEDMQVRQGLVIVTDGEKITDIVKEVPKSGDVKVIDLNGRYIMPGLINMHVHLAGNGKLIDNPKVKINRLVEKELDRFL